MGVSALAERERLSPARLIESRMGKGHIMGLLGWALVFLIVALIAAVFGFGGIASAAAGVAKVLFFIFIVVFVVLLITAFLGVGAVSA